MKDLQDILYKTGIEEVVGNTAIEIRELQFDSRKVEKGDLFFAIPGTQVDGHEYIDKAIAKGAIGIVCEQMPEVKNEKVVYIRVRDASSALGQSAANFFDQPSSKLQLVAVTGTNGKTSCVSILFSLFRQLGFSVGQLSTIENKINDEIITSTHTTPDAIQINRLLAQMAERGCGYCFMEASSHAIHQRRVDGLKFAGAVFTNLSHDHLDYHKTFKEYINAKKRLFDILPSDAFAIVNADDKNGMVMLQNTKAKKLRYALKSLADYRAKILETSFEGMMMQMEGEEVHTRLVGRFNAYNLLAVYGVALELGMDKTEVLTALSSMPTVEGRFDFKLSPVEKIVTIVDYAHTPDALKKVLETINDIRTGAETLYTVVGCGGNRDQEKRPLMAEVAVKLSDKVILTSDNPRNEDPTAILDDMEKGILPHQRGKIMRITDRKEAIQTACNMAQARDIILVAGKGHEKYQEVKGEKLPFDDKQVLMDALKTLER